MWKQHYDLSLSCSFLNRKHAHSQHSHRNRLCLLLQLTALVAVVTVAIVISVNIALTACRRKIRCCGRISDSFVDRTESKYVQNSDNVSQTLSVVISAKTVRLKPVRLVETFQRNVNDEGAEFLSLRSHGPQKRIVSTRASSARRVESPLTGTHRSRLKRKARWRRAAKTIDVEIRFLPAEQQRTSGNVMINFRSSSALFWKRANVTRGRRKRKKKRMKKKKRNKKKLDIRMKGKFIKSRKKSVSTKKLLKKAIAKKLKRKMRKMSRRAKNALAKQKKSKKARKKLFQSKMVAAVRATIQQVEKVCESLAAAARQKLGPHRVKVRCRFNKVDRLVRRLEKSRRPARNNRKLTTAISGIMAAVATSLRPLVGVLYRQTLARRRTRVVVKRLRKDVAKVLRKLLRQATGLRQAVSEAVKAELKLPTDSKSTASSSTSRIRRKLDARITSMEAGQPTEGMPDTVSRTISYVSRELHESVTDLRMIYRLRQNTEKKRRRMEGSCDDPVKCVNARLFRILQRMADRSSSLVRHLNRILPPPDRKTKKLSTPRAVRVDSRFLESSGGTSRSQDDKKNESAAKASRIIISIARNLRLVVGRLKQAVLRKKPGVTKLLRKGDGESKGVDKSRKTEKPEHRASKPAAKKPPPIKPSAPADSARKVSGTMTLKSLNRIMLSELRNLEKWSRLLYIQAASPSPGEAQPPTILVEKLSSTSADQSARQAANIVAAIVRRLHTVADRVGKTVKKKLATRKTSSAQPAVERADKIPNTGIKSATKPETAKPGKSDKKTVASAVTKQSPATKMKSKKGKKKSKEQATKGPSAKEKGKSKKSKKPPKVASATAKPSSEKVKSKKKGKKGRNKSDKKTASNKKQKSDKSKKPLNVASATAKPSSEKQKSKKGKKKSEKKPSSKEKAKSGKKKKPPKAAGATAQPSSIKQKSKNDKKISKKEKEKSKAKSKKPPKAASADTQPSSIKQESKKGKKKSEKETENSKEKTKKPPAAEQNISQKKPKENASNAPTTSGPGAASEPEPETAGHVITRDDMIDALVAQSTLLAETLRRISGNVETAAASGEQIESQTESDSENLWTAFMNVRLQAADSPTQKKETLDQMQEFTSRLLRKAEKLQYTISSVVAAGADEDSVMRSDRAIHSSVSAGHARHGHSRRHHAARSASKLDKHRAATHLGCRGPVHFAKPTSVFSVVNGIKSTLDDDRQVFRVAGLTSDDVEQGSNTDCALEFEFRRPVRLAGIWIQSQVRTHGPTGPRHDQNIHHLVVGVASWSRRAVGAQIQTPTELAKCSEQATEQGGKKSRPVGINSTTLYVQLTGDRGTWVPVVDSATKQPLILKVPSQPTSLPQYDELITGVRIYPQSWTNHRTVIPRPRFASCAKLRRYY